MLTRTRHARMPDHTQLKHAVRALRVPPVFVQQSPPSDSEAKHLARIQELEAEAAQARQIAAAAQQQLDLHASQAWIEAEERIAQQKKSQLVQSRTYAETAFVRDHTEPAYGPHIVATSAAVHLKHSFDAAKAVPMQLPVMSWIWNLLHRKP